MSHWQRWKRWHFQKRVTSQPNLVSFKWSHSVKLHSILIGVTLATTETVAFPKESDIATKPNPFKWSHSVKLHSILICISLVTMETVALPKESDIAAKTQSRSSGPTLSNCTRSSSVSHWPRWTRKHFQKRGTSQPKHNLVQMVPLNQIALDPHLCLIGYDGNGGISKRE